MLSTWLHILVSYDYILLVTKNSSQENKDERRTYVYRNTFVNTGVHPLTEVSVESIATEYFRDAAIATEYLSRLQW